jgi:hypothetical protein
MITGLEGGGAFSHLLACCPPATVDFARGVANERAMADLYSILGVARGADEAAIKKAYRKLAKELHRTATRTIRRRRSASAR